MKKIIGLTALAFTLTLSTSALNSQLISSALPNADFRMTFSNEGSYDFTLEAPGGVVVWIFGCRWIGEDGTIHGSETITIIYPDGRSIVINKEFSHELPDHKGITIFEENTGLQEQYLQKMAII